MLLKKTIMISSPFNHLNIFLDQNVHDVYSKRFSLRNWSFNIMKLITFIFSKISTS